MSAALARLTEQEDAFMTANDEYARFVGFLRSKDSRELNHTALEAAINEQGRELLRQLFQAHVDSRGPGPAAGPVCGADGVERSERRLHERGLSTVFGEVRVKRLGYGAAGVDSLHPRKGSINLRPIRRRFLSSKQPCPNSTATVPRHRRRFWQLATGA
jgi:hypothetical protein